MRDFKIGDTVRILHTHVPSDVPVGSVGTITAYDDHGYRVDTNSDDGWKFFFTEDELEHVITQTVVTESTGVGYDFTEIETRVETMLYAFLYNKDEKTLESIGFTAQQVAKILEVMNEQV